jgi:hypothetical protein
MASDFELQVMSELSEIKSLATSAVTSSQAMTERLFHPDSGVISTLQSDITEIKDDRKTDARWEKIHNVLHYSLTPIVVAVHATARHLGIDI